MSRMTSMNGLGWFFFTNRRLNGEKSALSIKVMSGQTRAVKILSIG